MSTPVTASTATTKQQSQHQSQQSPQPQPLYQFHELQTTIGKDYYDELEVNVYDETHDLFRDVVRECQHVLDDLLQVQAGQGKILLDYGCGTGNMVVEAAKRGLTVHAIDVSPTMIRLAKYKARKEENLHVVEENDDDDDNDESTHTTTKPGTIRFHHAGFLTYEHHNGQNEYGDDETTTTNTATTEGVGGAGGVVDYITTTYALHHLPDFWKQIALNRLSKLLKKNGRLHIRDVVLSTGTTTTDTNSPSTTTTTDILNQIERFVAAQTKLGNQHNEKYGLFLKDDAETHFREEFSTYDWVLEGMIERAGLTIVTKEVENDNNGVIITYLCEKCK